MKRALVGLCALALALPATGRQQAQQPTMTLHATTHLVQVNVIVLDRHGNPLRGLTRADFKVFDNGKPQKIVIFRVKSNQPLATAPKLPSNAFSNYAERAGSAPPSVTVILLDALNTPVTAQLYARRQVVKFLEQLQPNDYVAVYALTGRLMVLHDFTSDSSALLEALRDYDGRRKRRVDGGGPPGGFSKMGARGKTSTEAGQDPARLDQWLGDIQSVEDDYNAKQRVRITADALTAIANHLRDLPGRKNLVWVSAGFPFWNALDQVLGRDRFTLPQGFRSPASRAARALNDVNLAIYPVDALGPMAEPSFSVTVLTNVMGELARRTGGKAFNDIESIRHSIRRVVDNSRVNYVLGYYPQDVKWKGEFRRIKVKIDRPRVRLQYRHGYAAMPEEKVLPPKNSRTLDAVVNSPLDATGIGLAVQMLPDKGASTDGGPAYLIRLQINPKDIKFERQGSLRIAKMTLVTDEFGPQGRNLKGVAQGVQIHLKPAIYQKVLTEGMGFGARLLIPILFNAARLRVVIRDDSTGRMGSVNVRLDHGFLPAKPFFTKRLPGG